MKLKYYMRGLGIGMVVTAFILSVVIDKDTKTMSDDEVMARARELGMVESTVLSQMAGQNKPDSSETDDKENQTSASEPEETQTKTEVPSETESDSEPEVTPETEQVPETEVSTEPEVSSEPEESSEPEGSTESESGQEDETEPVELITIVITPGETSESVSRSMEEAGLVESAKELDRYLCNNGFDDRISIGTYEIAADATIEEIAKIITKGR